MKTKISTSDSGVYYFLGNITSHITHALPLYEQLGGTFIVTSDRARRIIESRYNVPVLNVDNRPFKLVWTGRRFKRLHHYIVMDEELKKSYIFLNNRARIVIFYELFEIERPDWLTRPIKIFLTHGNMLKNYMKMYPKRLEIVKQYDFMAALGPYMKNQFVSDGIPAEKLVDIGIARTDKVVANKNNVIISKPLKAALGTTTKTQVVAYLPTFWGPSSIYGLGLEILKNFPDNYILLFRPHPQTPKKILWRYDRYIKSRTNIIQVDEGRYPEIDLVDIFNASSIIIGDVSSVMLEALLLNKPLIFAYANGKHRQNIQDYASIADVVSVSQSVDNTNVTLLPEIINKSLDDGVDKAIWRKAKDRNFYFHDGNSVQHISAFISNLVSSEQLR